MKISALQLDSILGDRAANQTRAANLADQAMRAADKPDVLVLPELWDLGFYPDNALELGDVDGASARAFLGALAAEYRVNMVGGSVVRRLGDVIRNTCFVFDRSGAEVAAYDKIHSFSHAGEHRHFQAGDKTVLFELDGVPCAAIICYDMRFCELVRMNALAGAQVLFVPAAWPHPRLAHWQILARARAIENQMFIVAVNACGQAEKAAGKLDFCGHSMLVDPWGTIIAEAGEGREVMSGKCDLGVIRDIRERINVFKDRRPELYKL